MNENQAKEITIQDNSGDNFIARVIGSCIEIEAETYGETVFLLFTQKQQDQLRQFAQFILDNVSNE